MGCTLLDFLAITSYILTACSGFQIVITYMSTLAMHFDFNYITAMVSLIITDEISF